MTLFEAIVIAIVEGITEFLPISSTGHMIIASSAFGVNDEAFTKLFEVAIQLGAILAVVILYWQKFFQLTKWQFYAKLLVGVVPALLLGYLFNDLIDEMLGSTTIVAVAMVLGGVVLLFVDNWFSRSRQKPDILATELTRQEIVEADEKLSYQRSFIIGCWQVLAMIPGVSRSAASIIGGMQQNLTRNFAAEFSFFLAVPTMFAATAYSLVLKNWGTGAEKQRGYELILASSENIKIFIIGNVVAFVVALVAIKFFISYLQRRGFRLFGWYRIIAGLILLALIFSGYMN